MKDIHIVSKLVARENNIDPDLVEDVNAFFWKYGVRAALSSMEHTSISIKHLGTITVSKRKVDQIILTLIRKIRNIRKSTRYKPTTVELLLEVNYEKLRKALKQRNILAKQYYENYVKRLNRIREAASNNPSKLGQSDGGDLESSEGGVELTTGGGSTGDSEAQVNMSDVSVQQFECSERWVQDEQN